MDWKQDLESAVSRGDGELLLARARERVSRVIRYLNGRLYGGDEETKWKIVRALGLVAADRSIMDDQRTADFLRRLVWALNDESGAVPYGVPEAIGEILAVRPEFQDAFLPILCSLLTEDEMCQTGPVELGALWAVGRVGKPVAAYSDAVVASVRKAAEEHPDAAAREVASRSLREIIGPGDQ